MENKTCQHMPTCLRMFGALMLLSATVALFTYAYTTWQESKERFGPTTINVTGEGEILAKPDIGSFSFSVRAEGDDAATAQELSAEAMNTILAYLSEQGIEDKDIKTQYYNLNPKYTYEERICVTNGYCPPGEQIIDGYEITQSVAVKLRDLDASGAIISGVGERGATNISSLQFTIDDTDALQEEARAAAIADAQAKADVLAKDLGVRVVRMVGYNEGGMYYPATYDSAMRAFGGDAMEEAMAVAPSLPTGENTITSTVTITYEVR